MDISEQIKKHERAIEILELIKQCQKRIDSQIKWTSSREETRNIQREYYLKRIKINTVIKNRLQKYYDSTFKL